MSCGSSLGGTSSSTGLGGRAVGVSRLVLVTDASKFTFDDVVGTGDALEVVASRADIPGALNIEGSTDITKSRKVNSESALEDTRVRQASCYLLSHVAVEIQSTSNSLELGEAVYRLQLSVVGKLETTVYSCQLWE
jgi:hypothetical protein